MSAKSGPAHQGRSQKLFSGEKGATFFFNSKAAENVLILITTCIGLTDFLSYTVQSLEANSTNCQFSCSPYQCVNRSVVCDGQRDCDNGYDEYCRKSELFLSHYPLPCFRCGDGSCISPIPLELNNLGISDWFLCDGIPHCKDSLDEDIDACWRYKHIWQEKTLITCVPADLQFGQNDVMMWGSKQCNGVIDCFNGVDEKKCSWKGLSEFGLFYSPIENKTLAIGILASLAVMVIPVAFLICKIRSMKASHRASTSTSDTVFTQVSTNDKDDTIPDFQYPPEENSEHQKMVACRFVLTSEVDKGQGLIKPNRTTCKSPPILCSGQ